MPCGNETCFEVRARIASFDTDVDILSIRRKTLRWDTNEPVPGSEIDLPPATADPGLLESIRSSIGRPAGFVVQAADCPDGCYCRIPANAHPMHASIEQDVYEFTYMYLVTRWVRTARPQDPNPDLDRLFDATTGRHVEPNSATDHLGPAAVRESSGQVREILFPLHTRFEATIRLKIRAEVFELQGACVELSVSGERARA